MSRDPFRLLEAEHEAALAALARLESAAIGLRSDPASEPDLAVARKVLQVLSTTVRQHNEREEVALFPLIEQVAPTMVFEDEHRTLWILEQELRHLLDAADPRSAAIALDIVDLLREHIAKENNVLFPMAREMLDESQLDALAERLAGAAAG
jgi:hemerythrin-like domain-containing protein